MARRLIYLLIFLASFSTVPLISYSTPISSPVQSYIQYKLADDHHYRPSWISFIHRQPDGSQLASIRYYRIVFHCQILPGSLYLRFSKTKPYRTVVQNRQDPSTIFAFRSVGAYSRVQIQNYISRQWLCMNEYGKLVLKSNISVDNLACTFRQNSDGPYLRLISEVDPSRRVAFNTLRLLALNPNLSRRYAQYLHDGKQFFQREQCDRFMFDSQIEKNLLYRTSNSNLRLKH